MAGEDPIGRFLSAAARAAARGVDTSPAALATVDGQGRPSVRIVLVRRVDARGFVFHTNYNSRKGRDLAGNANAALCFHWGTLEEQIRIEGPVTPLPPEESDDYFTERPRGSQIGAWASLQSAELPAREELETRYREFATRFAGRPVPRPPFWGGYCLRPRQVEFWYGRADRLHDRVVFARVDDDWNEVRLYP